MLQEKIKIDLLFYQSILLVIAVLVSFFYKQLFFTLGLGFLFFCFFLISNWEDFTIIKKWGGIPNLVTISRLVLLFTIPLINTNTSLAILSFVVICLDGLDGLLARKLNQVTDFGGRLDMEVDAFFCLIFSLLISIKHPELSWILLGGLLRYLYKIITFISSKSEFIESKKKYARFIAGFYFLSFPLFFLVEYPYGNYIISIGTLLVLFSFAISFYEFFTFRK
jgi:phosphatidylglycerophosphate synthase